MTAGADEPAADAPLRDALLGVLARELVLAEGVAQRRIREVDLGSELRGRRGAQRELGFAEHRNTNYKL